MNKLEELKAEYKKLLDQKWKYIKEYDEKIESLDKAIEEELRNSLPQPEWSYKVKVYLSNGSIWDDCEKGTEIVEVRKVIKNLDEIRPFWEEAKEDIPGIRNNNTGIKYFRKNKVLLHTGGGTLYLAGKYPIVEDDEWEEIKRGNIPKRLLSHYEGGEKK